MPDPSEPENYSIDEMMDRLKNRPDEDPLESGQLVTRSDGSQAIKVRKRKRRSSQPQKTERKNLRRARMIQVSAALILLLLVILAAGAAVVYTNSAPYRESLVSKITEATGAKPELEQFRMNPASANAGRLTLTWPEGGLLRELQLRNIRARVTPSSFLGKSLNGEEIIATESILRLDYPQPGQSTRETPATEASHFRFDRYGSQNFNLLFGDASATALRLSKSEASFSPAARDDRTRLLLNGGEIHIPGWPKFLLDRAHIEFRSPLIDVTNIRIRPPNDTRGTLELAGVVDPTLADQASTLALKLENYPLSGIVGTELGDLLTGRIDSSSSAKSNYLSLTPSASAGPTLDIGFQSSLGSSFELRHFPFLFLLARTLNDEWFESPAFTKEVTGTIRRSGGVVSISDLNFESRGRMALRGGLIMASNKQLSGTLRLGVSEAMIGAAANPRLNALFSPESDGFRWLDLALGGTASKPTDNFMELLDSASSARPAASPAASPAGVPSFEDLTRPD